MWSQRAIRSLELLPIENRCWENAAARCDLCVNRTAFSRSPSLSTIFGFCWWFPRIKVSCSFIIVIANERINHTMQQHTNEYGENNDNNTIAVDYSSAIVHCIKMNLHWTWYTRPNDEMAATTEQTKNAMHTNYYSVRWNVCLCQFIAIVLWLYIQFCPGSIFTNVYWIAFQ